MTALYISAPSPEKTMKRLMLLCLIPALSAAQTFAERFSSLGELLYLKSAHTEFPHPARDSGHTYSGKFYSAEGHYRDSTVGVFIPKNFRPGKSVDVVVHIHGWFNNVESTFVQFRLIEQFVESGVNAILLAPEGPKNAPDSFGGKLEQPDGFALLIRDVIAQLKRIKKIPHTQIGKVVLSGHSGAYRAMAFILQHGGFTEKIKEVYLFDALYGQTEKFAYWLDHSRGRLLNIYTDEGGTKSESELLAADLKSWRIPSVLLEEENVSNETLKKNRIVFIHTKLEHNDVLSSHNTFREFLKAGVLGR
jgi:hypothetical protein